MKKRYIHSDHEDSIYQMWEQAASFNPDTYKKASSLSNQKKKGANNKSKPFCILMPPPNANDPLHIGHAMFVTIEDILIRFHRMLRDDTLWLPGTDHAGIETQFVFEKKLRKQGKSRFHFDRETLYQMIWEYVQENSDTAVNQLKKIGASADWSRFKFMLDEDIVSQVLQTFNALNKKGLIYRDLKLVNYCPKCGTAFSELEVNHQQKTSTLYYIAYGPFTVATTRPETIFGDTAVAVNPNDSRYKKYIGQEIEVNYLIEKRKIKVIADDYVDPEFGTGALKITPLHDANDYEIWQRHKQELPTPLQVIDYEGRLNDRCGKYQKLKTHIAREKIVEDLEKAHLLIKKDTTYQNNIGLCYRCKNVIEPLPLPQFFVKVKPLVDKTLQKLDNKEVTIHGAGHDKILRHWLENLRDWNISRQIVWGIRMPIWYEVTPRNIGLISVKFIDQEKNVIIGTLEQIIEWGSYSKNRENVISQKKYSLAEVKQGLQSLRANIDATYTVATNSPGENYIQETDTFDTWFSSGQWPYTTLKTNNSGDFNRFYPTAVMETGYDILPFWVMRMLLLSIFTTNKVPFKDVYLHGLVRDQKGQKMSKSKGNVINPLEIIDQYGADALRMALVIRSSAGLDKSVGQADFKAMRNLTNKIWNAARYVLTKQPEKTASKTKNKRKPNSQTSQTNDDQQFEEKLKEVTAQITAQLQEFKIGLAAETVYNEFWHWFCDECIEKNKRGLISDRNLTTGLITFIKLLHPFVPFVTEAIWQQIEKTDKKSSLLISAPWPHTETSVFS